MSCMRAVGIKRDEPSVTSVSSLTWTLGSHGHSTRHSCGNALVSKGLLLCCSAASVCYLSLRSRWANLYSISHATPTAMLYINITPPHQLSEQSKHIRLMTCSVSSAEPTAIGTPQHVTFECMRGSCSRLWRLLAAKVYLLCGVYPVQAPCPVPCHTGYPHPHCLAPILVWGLCVQDPSFLLYTFRIIERQLGSRQFASFAVLAQGLSLVLLHGSSKLLRVIHRLTSSWTRLPRQPGPVRHLLLRRWLSSVSSVATAAGSTAAGIQGGNSANGNSLLAGPAALVGGPYGLLFASFVHFFLDVPASSRFSLLGLRLSDKV
ncbi:UBA domain-containing protein [Haematococcus lacustris]|uniref:UBA domain-containing protein n=1 Tax=Haematococcus lacustris TaxID=44745 RepID=A0A699Y714_HAELA|nr:UBA domain-containing protein [Haematococcus lacustris]